MNRSGHDLALASSWNRAAGFGARLHTCRVVWSIAHTKFAAALVGPDEVVF